jgi:hypothetical protein
MHLPDPMERAEAAAERMADELEQPDGRWKCYQCGAIFDVKEGGTLSPDPWAPPACGKCCSEYHNKLLSERLDLCLDEYARIAILTDNPEIKGLCERGQKDIKQKVPLISQRDFYKKEMEAAKAALRGREVELRKLRKVYQASIALLASDEATSPDWVTAVESLCKWYAEMDAGE